jgi:endonuclease/exonuclease/phosphatase (EEP) superfamily protein YafD
MQPLILLVLQLWVEALWMRLRGRAWLRQILRGWGAAATKLTWKEASQLREIWLSVQRREMIE